VKLSSFATTNLVGAEVLGTENIGAEVMARLPENSPFSFTETVCGIVPRVDFDYNIAMFALVHGKLKTVSTVRLVHALKHV